MMAAALYPSGEGAERAGADIPLKDKFSRLFEI